MTKCVNCRFRAKVDGKEKTGRIQITGNCVKFWFDYHDELNDIVCRTIHIPVYLECGLGEHITDFEIVPRDPETYRDWQVGDKVNDPHEKWRLEANKEVIFRSGELVICKNEDGDISGGYTCSQLFRLGWRLVLTDIEKQIIAERKKAEWKPEDGDICYTENKDGYCTPFIYRHEGQNRTAFYVAFDKWGNVLAYHGYAISNENIKMLRPATDEEKQRLFDAMAKIGKRWNAEKKVVEDIPKPYEFKKGEPVLVRNYSNSKWRLSAFLRKSGSGDVAVSATLSERDCFTFNQCIPYNEKTMHLLGTYEDYKEE